MSLLNHMLTHEEKETVSSKHLQSAISNLFEKKNVKDAHIFAWMVVLHMHGDLEDAGEWSLDPLYTDDKLGSIFNFIYHLSNDRGSVTVMKGLS